MFSVHAFKIPFSTPFQLAGKRFDTRNGFVLSFTDGDVTAFGEVAPLPGFSDEKLEEILAVVLQNQRELSHAFRSGESGQLLSVLHSIHKLPSLSFGLDTLQADYLAKKRRDFAFRAFIWKNMLIARNKRNHWHARP